MSEKHNGWANYNTWLVYTWMNNDEDSQKFFTEMVKEVYTVAEDQQYFTKQEEAVIMMAERLKEYFEEQMYFEGKTMYGLISGLMRDMLHGALSEVDWHEIASHSVEDMELTA